MELKDKAELIKELTEEELEKLKTTHGITVQTNDTTPTPNPGPPGH